MSTPRPAPIDDAPADGSPSQVEPGGQSELASNLRRWLRYLDAPERLQDGGLLDLLQRHGRMPASAVPAVVGRAGAELLKEAIERLRAGPEASRRQRLPYHLLKALFLDGTSRTKVAASLAMSDSTLARELTRAVGLLEAELTSRGTGPATLRSPEPVPRIIDFLPRAEQARQLGELLKTERLVHVTGPRGIGKTSLVAECTAAAGLPVLWYQLRAGLNDSLAAFLFDLGASLDAGPGADRDDELAAALKDHDLRLASRLVLRALSDMALLLVVDDYHFAEADPMLPSFIQEAAQRATGLVVVTISRRRERPAAGQAILHIPPFTVEETEMLLDQLRITADKEVIQTVHRWTSGLPQLIRLGAAWLKSATPAQIAQGTSDFLEVDEVQDFLLDSLTDLIDPDDRRILEAASVFRDRFTDEALAFVAERSRGQVLDTSRRLIRCYLATRSHDGQVAFFHAGVHGYVYARLAPEDRAALHERAAEWFRRQGDRREAHHHQALALPR